MPQGHVLNYGNNINALLPKKGEGKCGTFTQWSSTQQKKNNNTLNFAGKWMELENIILSEVTHTERQLSHVLTHKWFLNIKQRKPAYKPQSQRS